MSILRMVAMEIWHRKLGFAIALLAISVAVGYALCSLMLIRAHELRTEQRVAAMNDEIRKITLGMGFNINVLPSDQNLADFHSNDFAEKTMPYEYVNRLAQSEFVTSVRHLRPALIRKMQWPEYHRQIVLMGVSGVVPLTHISNPKKPLSEAIPQGAINLGSVLAEEFGLAEGQQVTLSGHELRVQKIYPPRGSKDDITAWVDLQLAQEILALPGQINLIQALECNCASVDRLAQIREEISQELGADVQVIELATTAIARAKARTSVQEEGAATVHRMQDRATVQVFLLTIAGAILIGMLALANVRERTAEIGILRALGTRTSSIMGLFLTKAFLLGALGAVLGTVLGAVAAVLLEQRSISSDPVAGSFAALTWYDMTSWPALLATLGLTPLLSILASWLPAILAAGQDPATVLAQD